MTTSTQQRGKRKTREGLVVSDAMQKTVAVRIERRIRHPLYGKEIKLSRKVLAHDESDTAQTGDRVRIMETRPLSRRKRWRVVATLEKRV